jgi:hypothetical protein
MSAGINATEMGQGAGAAAAMGAVMPARAASGAVQPAAPATLELGLLMQAAQAHQELADRSLARLETHAEGLDDVVREEIRRTFIAEFGVLLEEAGKATEALGRLRGTAARHFTAIGLVLAALPAAAALLLLWHFIPSAAQLASLRTQRAQLLSNIAQLHAAGAHIELRRCGPAQRLCVHVDRRAPAYGDAADYLIVNGY